MGDDLFGLPYAGVGKLVDTALVRRCWARSDPQYKIACQRTVPQDPTHIGLCPNCLERLRTSSEQ